MRISQKQFVQIVRYVKRNDAEILFEISSFRLIKRGKSIALVARFVSISFLQDEKHFDEKYDRIIVNCWDFLNDLNLFLLFTFTRRR